MGLRHTRFVRGNEQQRMHDSCQPDLQRPATTHPRSVRVQRAGDEEQAARHCPRVPWRDGTQIAGSSRG